MVGPAVEYQDLVDRIRGKFSLKRKFKVKVRDEDGVDMITMGDQDDLEMAIMNSKQVARRERAEMGKMEVSIFSLIRAFNHD
jgi:PB1 domain